MLKVGLTGGYATGKSFVANEFHRLGCYLVNADHLGHQALLPSGEAYAQTVAAFGSDILNPDQTIDRKKLGRLVFGCPKLLAKLSSFVHPAVFRLEEQLLAELKAADPQGIAIVEAAILIETGRFRAFDRLIVTACDVETQIRRGIDRDHLSRDQVLERMMRQMSLDEQRPFADFIVDTTGSKENTLAQVATIFASLKPLALGKSCA